MKDGRRHDALSLALVDYLDLDGCAPAYMHVAELLRPVAKAAVDEAFNKAVASAATDKEALELFYKRMLRFYTCRLTELAFIRLSPRLPHRQLKGQA